MLDIWLELSIVIVGYDDGDDDPPVKGADDLIIAALGLNGLVPRIRLWGVPNSLLARCAAMMQDLFPTLTDLDLWLADSLSPMTSVSVMNEAVLPAPSVLSHANSSHIQAAAFAVARNKLNADFHELFKTILEREYLIKGVCTRGQGPLALHVI